MTVKKANILLAHGSSDVRWQDPFHEMTEEIRSMQPNDDHALIKLAFMELCEPSLQAVCEQLKKEGVKQIDIYPLFFAAGRHLRVDVPNQLAAIEAQLGVQTLLHPPIGQEQRVKQAIADTIISQL